MVVVVGPEEEADGGSLPLQWHHCDGDAGDEDR